MTSDYFCWRRLLCTVVAAWLCINTAQAQNYKQYYNQMLRRFRTDQGPSPPPSAAAAAAATTAPPPSPRPSLRSSDPPTDAATEADGGHGPVPFVSGSLVSRGHFRQFYKEQWRAATGRGSGPRPRPRSSSLPSPTVDTAPESSSGRVVIPPRLAALLPRGVEFNPDGSVRLPPGVVLNPDGIPKSMLAVLNGDPDYTRLRQLFLRQMCQRLINRQEPHSLRFCFSILAL